MEKISWTKHITNEEVLPIIGEKRTHNRKKTKKMNETHT